MFTEEVVKYVVNESQKIPKKVDILEFTYKSSIHVTFNLIRMGIYSINSINARCERGRHYIKIIYNDEFLHGGVHMLFERGGCK